MKKLSVLFLFLTVFTLVGCLPAGQLTATPPPTDTAVPKPAATSMVTVPTQSAFLPDSGCTVKTTKPTPGPTPTPVFPVVTSSDWVKGPATARVTIIEYSDFQ